MTDRNRVNVAGTLRVPSRHHFNANIFGTSVTAHGVCLLHSPRRRRRRQTRHRRGVLLLVVLSMLVLFMLVGTAFLMTSSQYRTSAKAAARLNQFENQPADLLERALKQVLRDTQNPSSVVRYHSLLRDMYGADGFAGTIFVPPKNAAAVDFEATCSKFAGAVPADALGVTRGQLIEFSALPIGNKLESDSSGSTMLLSQTNDYYNGRLLTMLSGPAAGQSVRIIDYSYDATRNLARFRVMSMSRADGTPLTNTSRLPEIAEFVAGENITTTADPNDMVGHSFLVNGRPFNGTGVGYNPLAAVGTPRLNAYEALQLANNQWIGAEVALSPNAAYFFPASASYLDPTLAVGTDPFTTIQPNNAFKPLNTGLASSYASFASLGDADESYDAADFQNMYLALMSVMPRARGQLMDHLGTIGTAGTVYDVDYPRVRQLLANLGGYKPMIEDVPLPSFHRPDLAYFWFLRLFKSAWLTNAINDEEERTIAILQPLTLNPNGDLEANPAVSGLDERLAGQIAAIKRKFMLRPLREDHKNFDGSNPASRYDLTEKGSSQPAAPWEVIGPWDVDNDNDGINDSIWIDLGDPVQETADGRLVKPLYAFLIIDQDGKLNLNAHGTSEHLVNVNLDNVLLATGNSGNLAGGAGNPLVSSNNLATGAGWGPAEISLRPIFPYPVDNTGIPLLPANIGPATDDYARLLYGRPAQPAGPNVPALERVTFGRYGGFELMQTKNTALGLVGGIGDVHPGKSYKAPTNLAELAQRAQTRDPHTNFDYVGYSVYDPTWVNRVMLDNWPGGANQANLQAAIVAAGAWNAALQTATPGAFGVSPDLRGRTAIGISYTGQPVYESTWEWSSASPWGNGQLALWPLVDDCPYELDLSEEFRNDTVADAVTMQSSSNAGAPLNDDAPFAIAELERIVRSYDADAGALPDRLWNLVDAFDPVKLSATPRYLVNFPSDPTVRLYQAQLDASVNRRLVTTDSWDVPAPAGNMYTRCLFGADGLPGTPNNRVVNNGETIWPDAADSFDPDNLAESCDDYFVIMGEAIPTSATIVDYLRYRIVLELKKKKQVTSNTLSATPALEQRVNAIISGGIWFDQNNDPHYETGLIAPDILAGLKMDLNRPFGDGKDNNNNGVVDEFLEAGEPFFDGSDPPVALTDGNGRWDAGEPFMDLDGNGTYSPPLDRALVTVNPSTSAPFDYGHPADGVARYIDGNTARQRYARHLYVLALLTMDENYVAPYDEDSLQIQTWIKKLKEDLIAADASLTPQDAELIARKKLTYREVAQWAINSAEMRDSDVIMTPFEYDENPWDGWNVVVPSVPVAISIDGDPATDENAGFTWTLNGIDQVSSPAPPVTLHTRGIVWGTERPELLITETLGLHDRRTEDLQPNDSTGHGTLENDDKNKWNDDDLDQRHRPRGSAFVEVYNPWSSDGQRPAELYSRILPNGNLEISPGVELGRLSNGYIVENGVQKRSPIWRLIVVEEHPTYRNDDALDNERYDTQVVGGVNNPPSNATFRYSDPDFPGFDYNFKPNWVRAAPQPANVRRFDDRTEDGPNWNRNIFSIRYPYVEKEFYFTTNHSPTIDDISPNRTNFYRYTSSRYDVGTSRDVPRIQSKEFLLRIPDRSIHFSLGPQRVVAQTQKFIHPRAEDPTDPTRQIAPILPGSYGVIGSAGTQYTGNNPGVPPDAFTSVVSRWIGDSERNNQSGSLFRPNRARRIELLVGRAQLGQLASRMPVANQARVLNNGGVQSALRDNELRSGTPNSGEFGPAVAIPVEGMNISEPPWEYQAREFEMSQKDSTTVAAGSAALRFTPTLAKGEGMFAKGPGPSAGDPASYDTPFDDAPELVRTGTTLNYRMIHLQRLANPLLPWNPAPGEYKWKDFTGVEKDAHIPTLPVNPYRTADSSSADLTAYNGISSAEADQTDQADKHQLRPWARDAVESGRYARPIRQQNGGWTGQWWLSRSHERGAFAALTTLEGSATDSFPTRAIWQQEPAKSVYSTDYFLDLLPWVDPTAKVAQDRVMERRTMKGIDARPAGAGSTDGEMHVDMVLEHSLGFGNEAVGRILSVADNPPKLSTAPDVYSNALGAPAINRTNTPIPDPSNDPDPVNDSTYPWLVWNNRPYASGMELLQVPSRASSELLRNYSVVNPNLPATLTKHPILEEELRQPAPYYGDATTNKERWIDLRGHFGQITNFFQSSGLPATVSSPPAGQTELIFQGAPNFYRMLDYLYVPSKFIGNDTLLNPIVFNRIGQDLTVNTVDDVANPFDPRQSLLAPFNRVAKYREPGRVNLNTVLGRSDGTNYWSEVYDGIMHRLQDRRVVGNQLSHLGPAWRDVALSRRGYASSPQFVAALATGVRDNPSPMLLNEAFPTVFANPFRAASAGDMVPLNQMLQHGVDASILRAHPYSTGKIGARTPEDASSCGRARIDDDGNGLVDDANEAGLGDDILCVRAADMAIPDIPGPPDVKPLRQPLFADEVSAPSVDGQRNPALAYSALQRLGSSATTRSNVFAVWVTVGFFEVEPAPSWNDPDAAKQQAVRDRFGGDRTLYDRVYPEGYALAQEVGSDTGDVKRHRAFYIIDRTLPVGFKPGEDVNVENIIKLRRRIE